MCTVPITGQSTDQRVSRLTGPCSDPPVRTATDRTPLTGECTDQGVSRLTGPCSDEPVRTTADWTPLTGECTDQGVSRLTGPCSDEPVRTATDRTPMTSECTDQWCLQNGSTAPCQIGRLSVRVAPAEWKSVSSLLKLVLKYLGMPTTSVPLEKIFFKGWRTRQGDFEAIQR